MATDNRSHTVPAGTGHPQRSDILNLSLSLNDAVPVSNTTTRNALATTLSASISSSRPLLVFRADAAAYEWTVDGTNWFQLLSTSAWAAYTPTLTNLTVGTGGTVAARWKLITPNTAMVHFKAVLGSSGFAVGTGPDFTLPSGAPINTSNYNVQDGIGSGLALDSSGGAAGRIALSNYVVTVGSNGRVGFAGSGGTVTATVPFTWAAGDSLTANVIYEI